MTDDTPEKLDACGDKLATGSSVCKCSQDGCNEPVFKRGRCFSHANGRVRKALADEALRRGHTTTPVRYAEHVLEARINRGK